MVCPRPVTTPGRPWRRAQGETEEEEGVEEEEEVEEEEVEAWPGTARGPCSSGRPPRGSASRCATSSCTPRSRPCRLASRWVNAGGEASDRGLRPGPPGTLNFNGFRIVPGPLRRL